MTEHGAVLIDGIQKASTRCCPHCGRHFLVMKGNLEEAKQELGAAGLHDLARGKIYCRKCGRLTCGRAECDPFTFGCIPTEARLEHVEGTRTRYDDAIRELEQQGGILL